MLRVGLNQKTNSCLLCLKPSFFVGLSIHPHHTDFVTLYNFLFYFFNNRYSHFRAVAPKVPWKLESSLFIVNSLHLHLLQLWQIEKGNQIKSTYEKRHVNMQLCYSNVKTNKSIIVIVKQFVFPVHTSVFSVFQILSDWKKKWAGWKDLKQ